jgi:prephenate dehydrogenase
MNALVDKVVVVGTGLIGASVAGAIKVRSLAGTVVGVGRSRANLDTAVKRGLIDEGSQDLSSAIMGAELVLLAAPVDTCRTLLAEIAQSAARDCTISDVGSVKSRLVAAADALGIGPRFVGAHPMAGGTATGAQSADANLFEGCTVVVTPAAAEQDRVKLVRDLWSAVGAKVIEMESSEHDRIVAKVSHLPQMLSYALAASLDEPAREQFYQLAGNGLRDTTRLAGSDPAMWTAIAQENRDELLQAMDELGAVWTRLRDAVEQGDMEAMARIVDSARGFRAGLEKA